MPGHRRLHIPALLLALSAVAGPLRAQCPDGSPPPCRGAAPARRPNPPLDERTWIVVPFENVTRAADIEGYPEIGGLFRDTSEAETGHAFGHMDFLKSVGDPATDGPFGSTRQNLQSAVESETYEYTRMYPGMAKTAREEGFPEIAEWFETLAKAERSHAGRFTKGLEGLKEL